MDLPKLSIFCLICALSVVVAPPVTHSNKSSNEVDSKENEIPNDELKVEYDRYLKEVVEALESDPQFREKLQKAEDADIRSGKIAQELEFVSHAVRTRLDEVKRTEVERIRKYARKAYELQQGLDTDHLGIHSAPDPEHLDHSNPETFEAEDLRKLIAKVKAHYQSVKDVAEADKKRREEFKEYEMQKEFENREKAKNMTEDEQKKFESERHQMESKHKQHAPLHHPISKPQLEEVWEKSDHMENQDFDPKTFFYLHDLDGNGVWDIDEVKALFLKELDKMYQAGTPEDDMRERVEEMERMREHVFQESDTNRDGLISYEEFLAQTKKADFNSDPGWETLDQQQAYTPEEYHKYELQRQHEIEAMIANGKLPPHAGNMHHGGYPQHPQPGHPSQFQGHPQQFQGHPQQFQDHPQQFQGQHQQFQGQHQQFQGQPQQFQGQHQQFQQGQPQQVQQGQPQQFQGQHQQFQQGQPQQFHQGQPQQFQQGQPQQFQQGQPQQFQGQHQQFQQGQPQQFQAQGQQFQPPPPQQFHGQPQQAPQAPLQAAPVQQMGQAPPQGVQQQVPKQQVQTQPQGMQNQQQQAQPHSVQQPQVVNSAQVAQQSSGQQGQAVKQV